jgi:hypothetical protein
MGSDTGSDRLDDGLGLSESSAADSAITLCMLIVVTDPRLLCGGLMVCREGKGLNGRHAMVLLDAAFIRFIHGYILICLSFKSRFEETAIRFSHTGLRLFSVNLFPGLYLDHGSYWY